MPTTLQDFDKKQAIRLEANFIVGIDEAGRGPLAGPVVACACFIPPAMASNFTEVNDSKKLSEKKREMLFQKLVGSVPYGIGFASAAEIDRLNILQATFLAMRRAAYKFSNLPDSVALIDGPYPAAGLTMRQTPVVDGDAKSLAIAAASIIAKVTRDHYMNILDRLYPGYGFAGHKGYGTAKHMQALRALGPCREHRRSFAPVGKLLNPSFLP
ncbi:ribonuclease HII [Candidatus Avelusimicrobium gallicola]|uniref:Ribonuclease HII n=1 Tax=Candidatus Avelusimicrobium gallicola TaxID=2562704 RepID=A0A1Y4DDY6_9BACT|nr:ribonuclease HII [Elusimicrobium sp. An273]OUO57256.1 ribonuclease HII [Elusimicrobium sp. An273]